MLTWLPAGSSHGLAVLTLLAWGAAELALRLRLAVRPGWRARLHTWSAAAGGRFREWTFFVIVLAAMPAVGILPAAALAQSPGRVFDRDTLLERVWGDSAYSGQTGVIRKTAPCAQDFTHHKGCRHRALTEIDQHRNRSKSKVRAKVEHVFRIIKCGFGFVKVRYRGLLKNTNRLLVTCALTNLYSARRRLMRMQLA